jgi:metal-responsive CopG/Arc/MetJ family transcriptional regulator
MGHRNSCKCGKTFALIIPEFMLTKFDRTAEDIDEARSEFVVNIALDYIHKTAKNGSLKESQWM